MSSNNESERTKKRSNLETWKRSGDTKKPTKKKRAQRMNNVGTPNFSLELFTLPFIISRWRKKQCNFLFSLLYLFSLFALSPPAIMQQQIGSEDQRFWLLGFGSGSLFLRNLTYHQMRQWRELFFFYVSTCWDVKLLFSYMNNYMRHDKFFSYQKKLFFNVVTGQQSFFFNPYELNIKNL